MQEKRIFSPANASRVLLLSPEDLAFLAESVTYVPRIPRLQKALRAQSRAPGQASRPAVPVYAPRRLTAPHSGRTWECSAPHSAALHLRCYADALAKGARASGGISESSARGPRTINCEAAAGHQRSRFDAPEGDGRSGTPPSTKVRAADSVLDHSAKAVELEDIEARLAELERAAEASNQQHR